jgi:hypothetical protein
MKKRLYLQFEMLIYSWINLLFIDPSLTCFNIFLFMARFQEKCLHLLYVWCIKSHKVLVVIHEGKSLLLQGGA